MAATIEEMIEKLEFYVMQRQIGLAEIISCEFENRYSPSPFKQSGYLILSVVAAYFEMIAQFLEGETSENQSKLFFEKGFRAVYPSTSMTRSDIYKIYSVVRCGMYHGGMPKIGCHLSRHFQPGFHLCRTEIHVNPAAIVREVKAHFCQYISVLRNPVNISERDKFKKMCEEMGLDQTPPDHTYCDTPGGTVFTTTTPGPGSKGDEPPNWKVDTER
jgi:hypothetical protein